MITLADLRAATLDARKRDPLVATSVRAGRFNLERVHMRAKGFAEVEVLASGLTLSECVDAMKSHACA